MQKLDLRAYEFGLRLGQLEQLLDEYRPTDFPSSATERAEVKCAIAILWKTCESLLTAHGQASPKLDVVAATLDEVARLWEATSGMNGEQLERSFTDVDLFYQLEELRDTFAGVLDATQIRSAELGRQLCKGYWCEREPQSDTAVDSAAPRPNESVGPGGDENLFNLIIGIRVLELLERRPAIEFETGHESNIAVDLDALSSTEDQVWHWADEERIDSLLVTLDVVYLPG